MSLHFSLRNLNDLGMDLQERDRGLALLLSRVSDQLASQNTLLERIAAQHAQILAALGMAETPAPAEIVPVDAGEIVVLADAELRSLIELAA
jgi:hypothetical protein